MVIALLFALFSTVYCSNGTSEPAAPPRIEDATIEIPDKPGATIKGRIHCDGRPLADVRVSDGVEFATTDAEGFYWLESKKKNGSVFVITPSGYEPDVSRAVPQFWAPLSSDAGACERHDFELRKVDNDEHVVLVTTDLHLANRNDDLSQYETTFYPDLCNTCRDYAGKKVYSICLGDMTWDLYWYSKQYALPQYRQQIRSYPCMIFHAMGNHDNDPYCNDDFEASRGYRMVFGPTYYSFNLGKVHYVILDNIEYVNEGGANGTVGDRSYVAGIAPEQLRWLAEDLSTVDRQTPIVVGMHIPLYKLSMSGSDISAATRFDISELKNLLKDFDTVHCLTGHTHVNCNVSGSLTGCNIYEHNIAGACATWWWTGYLTGNHICTDGSVGGYEVFEVDGTHIRWRYKSAGKSSDYQMRAYDMNVVKEYFRTSPAALQFLSLYPKRESYANYEDNSVLVNVWNWDEAWSIRVVEGTRELPVVRLSDRDPLHTLSYDIPRAVPDNKSLSFPSTKTLHLFKAVASTPDSPLTIEITDAFGRKYTQTMTRPKEFTIRMD